MTMTSLWGPIKDIWKMLQELLSERKVCIIGFGLVILGLAIDIVIDKLKDALLGYVGLYLPSTVEDNLSL